MDAVVRISQRLSGIAIYAMLDKLLATKKYQKALPAMIKRRLLLRGEYSTGEKIITYFACLLYTSPSPRDS